jgi:beta-alanine degradation protein BauB
MNEHEAWDTVQHDDDRMRVTRWDVPVGAVIAEHTHGYDYVVVPLVDGTMGITPRGGEPFTSQVQAGVSYAREAGASHTVANAGGQHLAFVEVELLDTDAGATTSNPSASA